MDKKQYLSITEAAAVLGVSRPTIYAKMDSGELPYNQISERIIRIPISAIQAIQSQSSRRKTTLQIAKHDLPKFITMNEAISKYGIRKSTFYNKTKAAGIVAIKYGIKILYPKDKIQELFQPVARPDVSNWYTSEELATREGISRKHICATAHKLGIKVFRAGSVCYIDKEGWDNRKLAPAIIERDYMTVDQAKQHYHIGGKTFYDKINASTVTKVKKGNFVYFLIKDLDRLFKDKGPHIPAEIKRDYIRSCDALKIYHIGQKRFTEETKAANVEKVRTEGNFVWYRKDQLDKLFKTLI